MQIPIVNEQDEIIGYKEREEITPDDIYRVSALWITNERGKILLARRGFTKSHNPGVWGPAVAGTVEEGETYESNIIKEAEEEIGLKNIQPIVRQKRLRRGNWSYFGQEFSLVLPGDFNDFTISEQEVAEIRWFSMDELKNEIEQYPEEFLNALKEMIPNYEDQN